LRERTARALVVAGILSEPSDRRCESTNFATGFRARWARKGGRVSFSSVASDVRDERDRR
jgi:hypothetical protein